MSHPAGLVEFEAYIGYTQHEKKKHFKGQKQRADDKSKETVISSTDSWTM